MKVTLVLETDDPELIEEDHVMGLSEKGFLALDEALSDAGFGIVTGPEKAE